MTSGAARLETPAVRPEQPDDFERITAVVRDAFGSDTEAILVDRIRASDRYLPDLALVAVLDGDVVGHVMVSWVDLVPDLNTTDVARRILSLAPLAVDPALHRQGIGSMLVNEAVARADRLGEPFIVLEGSPIYYGRLDFEPSAPHGIVLPLPSWAPPEAGQLRRLSAWSRPTPGRVVYPEAFDHLT